MTQYEAKVIRRSTEGESWTYSEPLLGKALKYDAGFDEGGLVDYDNYRKPGKEALRGIAMGLPKFIRGKLGCGCNIGYLHAVGELKNGQIEADYMCDSGWHNFVIFQMTEKKNNASAEKQYDKYGHEITEKSFVAPSLEDF